MAIMDEQPRQKPAVLPPPPQPEDGAGLVKVPPLEPPPSSLKPMAHPGSDTSPRESRLFWVMLVLLFSAGTALTFYLQR